MKTSEHVQIAHIQTALAEKFGVPRQSGLVEELKGRIVFEPEFRNKDALRGIEGFSHLWLLWDFSEVSAKREKSADGEGCVPEWNATVRPPRLGGNERVGVFATRSPFRPNPIGLSCVKLESVDYSATDGPCIIVSGIDLMDGTPIFDIKPYIPYADCRPEATGGFTDTTQKRTLSVVIPEKIKALKAAESFTEADFTALGGVLGQDPRPAYHEDSERIYRMTFLNKTISFKVENQTAEVVNIE